MLSRNGENLNHDLSNYLSGKLNVSIFCPYIKAPKFREILENFSMKCQQVVVRWEPRDLAIGASDIEIYEICKEHGITLYMNNRIHLKLFTNNFEDAFLGSANLSERAYSDDIANCNYEVNTYVNGLTISDRIYLEKIIQSSTLIDDELYAIIKAQIPENISPISSEVFEIPEAKIINSEFFINKLPMSESPSLIWKFYSGELAFSSQEEENCYIHDVVLYQIKDGIKTMEHFYEILAENFFGLTFVKTFLSEVDNAKRQDIHGNVRKGLQFGAVRKWFSEKTTSVPSPRAFELTKNVQILYTWIVELSDGNYYVDVPGRHSQVIIRI